MYPFLSQHICCSPTGAPAVPSFPASPAGPGRPCMDTKKGAIRHQTSSFSTELYMTKRSSGRYRHINFCGFQNIRKCVHCRFIVGFVWRLTNRIVKHGVTEPIGPDFFLIILFTINILVPNFYFLHSIQIRNGSSHFDSFLSFSICVDFQAFHLHEWSFLTWSPFAPGMPSGPCSPMGPCWQEEREKSFFFMDADLEEAMQMVRSQNRIAHLIHLSDHWTALVEEV